MIKSVEKALNILSYMIETGYNEPISLGEIAQFSQLNASTCAHLVETLCKCAYLEKISRKDGYILGPMGYCVATKQYYREDLIKAALPIMRKLCQEVKESVSISTVCGNRLFVPYTLHYHEAGCYTCKLQTGRLYCSASGRLALAYMSVEKLEGVLAAVGTPHPSEWDVKDRAALDAELATIRANGLAAYDRVSGELSAVAAPVLFDNKLQGVIGIYMPCERFAGDHLTLCVQQTKVAAKSIAKRLEERLQERDHAVYRASEMM